MNLRIAACRIIGAVLLLASSASQGAICHTMYNACEIGGGYAPAGTPCYCNSPMGPISGATGIESAPPVSFPQFCCTPAGRFGPFQNYSIPVGGYCSFVTPYGGMAYGQACF